jgi:hypothetical protein
VSRALAAAALVALACGTMLAASGRAFAPSTMPDTDAPPERIGSLELLGAVELPAGATLESEPIGGLSGLLWDPAAGCFLALSDDASEKAPARFYEVEIGLGEDGKLEAADVRFLRRVRLTDPRGEPFSPGGIDPEGFARLPDGDLVIGSEGVRSSGARPFLARFGRDGRERSRFELDERYLPDGAGGRGPRPNFGFESLAVTADGATLVAGLENALVQDGPMSDVATPSPARLLLRDLSGRGHDRELVYEVDAVRGVPPDTAAFRANGLVDLVALGPSRLLALEREFVAGAGSVVRLYEVELEGATDVTEHASLAAATGVVPVVKRLLLDFAELDVPLDNYEAMAFGPRLADGRRLLVVLSDDNFRPEEQRTRLIAFATSSEPRSIGALQGAFHHSPLRDRWVAGVEGVVTAVDPRARPPAFFLQATVPDGDPATSDGIRVAVEGLPLPAPGDRVGVRGRVEERAATPKQLPVTTLRLSALEALGSGVPLPAATRSTSGRAWRRCASSCRRDR